MSDLSQHSEEDRRLLEKARAGSHEAYDQLAQRYRDALLRYASSYLGDEGRAEDIVQETLAKLACADHTIDGALRPWLYKVTRNGCLDVLRRWQRSPTHNRRMKTGVDIARQTMGPRTRMARDERRELIRQLVADMPEEYRSVLMLKHFEGMSRTEMAAVLDVTEATVKGRLVRASSYLRDQLREISGFDSI